MRRKAVKAIVMHTKDSIQHLKDDDDEMLRGTSRKPAFFTVIHGNPACAVCIYLHLLRLENLQRPFIEMY